MRLEKGFYQAKEAGVGCILPGVRRRGQRGGGELVICLRVTHQQETVAKALRPMPRSPLVCVCGATHTHVPPGPPPCVCLYCVYCHVCVSVLHTLRYDTVLCYLGCVYSIIRYYSFVFLYDTILCYLCRSVMSTLLYVMSTLLYETIRYFVVCFSLCLSIYCTLLVYYCTLLVVCFSQCLSIYCTLLLYYFTLLVVCFSLCLSIYCTSLVYYCTLLVACFSLCLSIYACAYAQPCFV